MEHKVLGNEAQALRDKLFEQNEDKDKDKNKTKFKTKVKTKVKIKVRIKHKMDLINEINKRLEKAKTKLTNKVEPVYQAMRKLQDDLWLRLVELNKIDTILDDAINVLWYEIYGKNRKMSKMNNIDKHKDIKYVSKLTNIIKYKIRLTKIISMQIDCGMCNIKNKTNMVKEKINKASEMDNDHLNEIIIYLKKD